MNMYTIYLYWNNKDSIYLIAWSCDWALDAVVGDFPEVWLKLCLSQRCCPPPSSPGIKIGLHHTTLPHHTPTVRLFQYSGCGYPWRGCGQSWGGGAKRCPYAMSTYSLDDGRLFWSNGSLSLQLFFLSWVELLVVFELLESYAGVEGYPVTLLIIKWTKTNKL